ncbi:DEAD/DEAH box helicase [Aeromicrobium fastidiosum]|uniref:DEAD/DEAH box helicase n=1 Tax=Aeromicrobium fastidiosum TaxID=52699 RepID=A0A641ALY3_9ACTN|nr:DEAD/DEAH box helicase [Aeromicrobium fastidiosum]KAA1376288.1 DEAD/DEAH box helicase [Aeromicrobium fastidiosum]MBP2391816.1 ATP-dependent RNA helicase HelY [Aeromicrobium fastidiosum]
MSSPAEKYAQSRTSRQYPHLAEFRGLYDFGLDGFQVEACKVVEDGHGVLVAAPTGSGKTLVGEFAVHLALQTGRKCFYTTPIKALSNQKFTDLVERYGAENVGLLTGDNTINGEAPIVVMTTEVLRNMLYAGSRTLDTLGYVVMDEVHYLADRTRGAVWEEVIIHLAESVSVVALSATVSNAEEFGDWLTAVRGDTVTIVEERRPIPLHQHVLVGRKMFPLFEPSPDDRGVEVNKALERLAREDWQLTRTMRGHKAKGGRRPQSRNRTPSRVDVVERLDAEGLLPAITFVFSRAGCAAAVQQCLDARLSLTTPEEQAEITAFVDAACAHLPEADLHVLGFYEFRDGLARGIAAHHAGMLPTFKECVEDLFSAGFVKVIFATETLALGINMPARSVVIEKLSKWNGETHANITPGEYTQLTGRAGRRGIDVEGHGVVLWQPGLDPKQVAGLASTRTYPLNSSFHPSYNMAVNLVGQVGRGVARELLEQSFAQFQADRAVVGMARTIRKADDTLEGYRENVVCDRGDFMEYASLRRELTDIEASGSKARRQSEREDVARSLVTLRPGDVIHVPVGKYAGIAVVLDPGRVTDTEGPRPMVLTASRNARRLAMIDFTVPVVPLTTMRIPKSFNARNPQSRRDLASALRQRADGVAWQQEKRNRAQPSREDPRIGAIREKIRDHPCHQCPDREKHARWAERYLKLERDTQNQRGRIEQRTNTVARQFDRVCEVLDVLGYLDGDEVTADGKKLKRLYSDVDLLVSECLRKHVWDGLDAAELAAVVSGLTYQSRMAEDVPAPRLPTQHVREVAATMSGLCTDLQQLEREHRVKFLHQPDFGFSQAVWQWCNDATLDDVLGEMDLAAGDFVRAMKQLIDVTAQIADAAGAGPLRDTARDSLDLLRHGVVSYTSMNA